MKEVRSSNAMEMKLIEKDHQMQNVNQTIQKLVGSGQNSLADFVTNIVAVANKQYAEFGVDDVVTFRIRDVSANRAGIVGNYYIEYFVEDATEAFRDAVNKTYSAEPEKCCGGGCAVATPVKSNVEWQVKIRPSQKGLNIPKKVLDYLVPDRSPFTPVYVRPLEGSTDKFLVNATEGTGACWTVYPHKDGRYVINVTTQRKAFKEDIARKNPNDTWLSKAWTASPNGKTQNSVIFTQD